jgi:hypothetical protein
MLSDHAPTTHSIPVRLALLSSRISAYVFLFLSESIKSRRPIQNIHPRIFSKIQISRYRPETAYETSHRPALGAVESAIFHSRRREAVTPDSDQNRAKSFLRTILATRYLTNFKHGARKRHACNSIDWRHGNHAPTIILLPERPQWPDIFAGHRLEYASETKGTSSV